MPPIAKAKKRKQEQEGAERRAKAISGFQTWKKKHPNATTQQCFDAFDRYIDSIELDMVINAHS